MYCGRCDTTRIEFSLSTGTNLTMPASGPLAPSRSPPPAVPTIASSSLARSLALAVSSGNMPKLTPFNQSTSNVFTNWSRRLTSCGVPATMSRGREASAFRMRSAGRKGCAIFAISGALMFLSGITCTPKPWPRSALPMAAIISRSAAWNVSSASRPLAENSSWAQGSRGRSGRCGRVCRSAPYGRGPGSAPHPQERR